MDAPEFNYFFRKYEDYENKMETPKRGHSKNAYNYCRLFDDSDDNNGRIEMTYFLILSMAGTTATF